MVEPTSAEEPEVVVAQEEEPEVAVVEEAEAEAEVVVALLPLR